MSAVRSMTGFATHFVEQEDGVRLSLKSVNHRFLDISLRLPPGSELLEMRLRRMLKERMRRGHVEFTVSVQSHAENSAVLDETVLARHVEALRAAARRFSLPETLDLAALARLPGVLSTHGAPGQIQEAMQERVLAATETLLSSLDAMREEEGAALAEALRRSLSVLGQNVAEARGLRAGVRDAHLARLRDRLKDLVGHAGAGSDARLLTEAALLADRSDIEEELLRLDAHIGSFATALEQGGEVGKRLDFLTQEMNREVTTLLAKSGSAAGKQGLRLTELGLACKAEVERMREQVQNIE